MSGYLYFDGTGSNEIDEILAAIEKAGRRGDAVNVDLTTTDLLFIFVGSILVLLGLATAGTVIVEAIRICG
jgi:hypothetical protein